MTTHLYDIGDVVSLNFHEGRFFSKLNPFTVEAKMPHLGSSLQYRIKSKSELCRRVVAEHQLSSMEQSSAEPALSITNGLIEESSTGVA